MSVLMAVRVSQLDYRAVCRLWMVLEKLSVGCVMMVEAVLVTLADGG